MGNPNLTVTNAYDSTDQTNRTITVTPASAVTVPLHYGAGAEFPAGNWIGIGVPFVNSGNEYGNNDYRFAWGYGSTTVAAAGSLSAATDQASTGQGEYVKNLVGPWEGKTTGYVDAGSEDFAAAGGKCWIAVAKFSAANVKEVQAVYNLDADGKIATAYPVSKTNSSNGALNVAADGPVSTYNDPVQVVDGETVTATATPATGFETSSVTYTDEYGVPQAAQVQNDGTWTFLMPALATTVSATFAEKSSGGQPIAGQTKASMLCDENNQEPLYYDSLDMALSAASGKTNATVQLYDNVELTAATAVAGCILTGDNSFVLDLNGKTLTVNGTTASTPSVVQNSGALNITAAGKVLVKNGSIVSNLAANGVNVNASTADVTFENVTFSGNTAPLLKVTDAAKVAATGTTAFSVTQAKRDDNNQTVDSAADGTAIVDVAGGVFTMAAGSITGGVADASVKGYEGIKSSSTATVNLGDKDATAPTAAPTITTMYAAVENGGGIVNVYGGTFNTSSAKDTAAQATTAIYAGAGTTNVSAKSVTGLNSAATTTASATALNIKDGAFAFTADAGTHSVFSVAGASDKLSIEGGTIGTEAASKIVDNVSLPNFIKGGTFYVKPNTADGTPTTGTVQQVAAGYTYDTTDTSAKSWTVKGDLSAATFKINNTAFNSTDQAFTGAVVYDGTAQTPEVTVSAWASQGDAVLEKIKEGADFEVKYYDNAQYQGTGSDTVTSGTCYAQVTPGTNGKWLGRINLGAVPVQGVALSDLIVKLSTSESGPWSLPADFTPTYTGQQIKPYVQVSIKAGDQEVVIPQGKGTAAPNYNYSVEYGINTATGDASVIIGAGGNADSLVKTGGTVNFTITSNKTLPEIAFPSDAKSATIALTNVTTAAGNTITVPAVVDGTTQLTQGVDFKVYVTDPQGWYYQANGTASDQATGKTALEATSIVAKKVGEYTFTFEGMGTYATTSTRTATFTIDAVDISSATDAKLFVNLGSRVVVADDNTNTLGVTTTNYEAGGLPVKVAGVFKKAGVASGAALDLNCTSLVLNDDGTINTASSASFAFTDPETGGQQLELSTSKIMKSGTQALTVTGTGFFKGSQTINVTVNAIEMTSAAYTIVADDNAVYDGKEHKPGVTITKTSSDPLITLTQGQDYSLRYYKKGDTTKTSVTPKEVGAYVIEAKGENGYGKSTSLMTVDWSIVGKPIGASTVTVEPQYNAAKDSSTGKFTKFAFTGADYDLSKLVTVKDGETTLTYGTDYTITPSKVSSSRNVTVYGAGNYSGTTTLSVKFTTAVLSETATASLAEELTFKPTTTQDQGALQTPKFKVTNTATQGDLKQGSDYQFTIVTPSELNEDGTPKTWNDPDWDAVVTQVRNAGYYKAVIKGAGNYTGTDVATIGASPNLEVAFEVKKFNLSNFTLPTTAPTIGAITFNGATQYPVLSSGSFAVKYDVDGDGTKDDVTLTQNTTASKKAADIKDFTTAGVTNAGKNYKVSLVGEGNYEGTVETSYTYDVAKLQASSFANQLKFQYANTVGTSTVWTDDFTGPKGAEPTVRVMVNTKADGSGDWNVLDAAEYGSKVVYGTGNKTPGANGKVTATFSGSANIADGSIEDAYTIAEKALSDVAQLKFAKDSKPFTGNPVDPEPSVVNKTTLEVLAGSSFVYYTDDPAKTTQYQSGTDTTYPTKAGTYHFVAYGSANNYGTLAGDFTVTPLDITKKAVTVDGVSFAPGTAEFTGVDYTYDAGEAIEPVVAISGLHAVGDANGTAKYTEKDADFKVAYENNVNAGTATVTVTGLNNYADSSFGFTFKIAKAKFYNAATIYRVEGSTDTYKTTFTGSAIEPKVTVTNLAVTKELVEGKDYEVTYANNTDATYTAQIVIVPLDTANYSTASADYPSEYFWIQQADLTSDKLDVKATFAEAKYNGQQQTPALTITYTPEGGKAITLKQGLDYTTPVYSGATEVGQTGTAMVVGLGNYTGTLRPEFTVAKGDSKVTLANKTVTYNGKAQAIGAASVTGSKGAVTYKYYSDSKCTKSATPKDAGTYYAVAAVAEDANYGAATSNVAKLVVNKAANPLKIAKATRNAKKVSKKNVTVKGAKVSKSGQGKVTWSILKIGSKSYKKSPYKGNFKIKSNGKITVAKGTKAGTYKVKVKAIAAGNANYAKSAAKTAVVTIKVKK